METTHHVGQLAPPGPQGAEVAGQPLVPGLLRPCAGEVVVAAHQSGHPADDGRGGAEPGRGTEDEAAVARRFETAREELAAATEFDRTVVNDDVETAADRLLDLLVGPGSDGGAHEGAAADAPPGDVGSGR